LAVQAITNQQRRVRFFPTIESVNTLEQEKAAGKQGQLASRLMSADLVILDELGYLFAFPTSYKDRRIASAQYTRIRKVAGRRGLEPLHLQLSLSCLPRPGIPNPHPWAGKL
jgi:hypothetical protein